MDFYFIIFSTLITFLFVYLRQKYTYWEFIGVPQLKTHFLFGNIFSLRSIHMSEILREVYKQFKGKAKIAGAYTFTKPIAVVLDLEVVKSILIKDFNKFVDRLEYHNEKRDPLSAHLFNLYGEKWRSLRTKLTPTFTSGKIKAMFPLIVDVAKELSATFERMVDEAPNKTIEMYDLMGRFTTDVIGTCAFGIKCNSLKDPEVEFRRMGRNIFAKKYFCIRWQLLLNTYSNFFKHIGFTRFGGEMQDFFMRVVRETVAAREKNNIKRNDFIDLLIELKNSKDLQGMPGLTIEQVAAQVFIFFAAGFETSSSNLSYCLFELAKNQGIQDKLRAEILQTLEAHNGELTYDAMNDMTYLDCVVSETLRMYPALAALNRIATVDYPVTGTNITLEKGTRVFVPVREIHSDPDIYENPEEFQPERFSAEETQKRHPQAFLGFGDGPRNCIGLRFGRMQVRIGLITLLKSFKFSIPENAQRKVAISQYSFVLIPAKGVWLQVEKL